jgi:hypothetical protein
MNYMWTNERQPIIMRSKHEIKIKTKTEWCKTMLAWYEKAQTDTGRLYKPITIYKYYLICTHILNLLLDKEVCVVFVSVLSDVKK